MKPALQILRSPVSLRANVRALFRPLLNTGFWGPKHFSLACLMLLVGSVCSAGETPPPPVTDTPSADNYIKKATFAGGCFWCMEKPFDVLDGVSKTVSGYTGGLKRNPTYKQVSAGGTGHYEVVQVTYDSRKISFGELLDIFWVNVDPLDAKGQFCDKGSQYLSAIFYRDEEEKRVAETSLASLKASKKLSGEIATKILPMKVFYPAEDYHQDYYQKNPLRYRYYRAACGRDKRLRALWGKKKSD